jgi:hypothetical protein
LPHYQAVAEIYRNTIGQFIPGIPISTVHTIVSNVLPRLLSLPLEFQARICILLVLGIELAAPNEIGIIPVTILECFSKYWQIPQGQVAERLHEWCRGLPSQIPDFVKLVAYSAINDPSMFERISEPAGDGAVGGLFGLAYV